MNGLLIACLLVPMISAVASFVWPGSKDIRGKISIVGSSVLLILSLILLYKVVTIGPVTNQMGGWQAPMGITLIADLFSAMLITVTAVVALMVSIYSLDDISEQRVDGGFYTFLNMLIAGVVGAFLTGDLFNLYVWFEVMLISSFALLVLGGNKVQLDGAVKYVAINLISTVLLLTAIGLLYGLTGTLNMADLSQQVPEVNDQSLVSVVAVLFLIAFGIKAAVFPLYFWLPASYHTLPISVTSVFAALMTKVGVYALIRTFTLIFPGEHPYIDATLLGAGLVTMIFGVMGAITHTDIRRILSFHVIGSIGFMLLGLGLGSSLAMAASIFYMVHGILIKALLFMIAGIVGRLGGSYELGELGGLYRDRPGFSLLFLLAALSLIGIPPLSGFWAKVLIIDASLQHESALVIAFVVASGILTFIPLIRIWSEAFWKARPSQEQTQTSHQSNTIAWSSWAPICGLSVILLAIGFAPSVLISASDQAAESLLSPDGYQQKVLVTNIDPTATGVSQ